MRGGDAAAPAGRGAADGTLCRPSELRRRPAPSRCCRGGADHHQQGVCAVLPARAQRRGQPELLPGAPRRRPAGGARAPPGASWHAGTSKKGRWQAGGGELAAARVGGMVRGQRGRPARCCCKPAGCVAPLRAPTPTFPPASPHPPPNRLVQPDDASQLPSVLLVGNPALSLKGFDCALAALALVQRSRPIQVWGGEGETFGAPAAWLACRASTCLAKFMPLQALSCPTPLACLPLSAFAGALGVPAGTARGAAGGDRERRADRQLARQPAAGGRALEWGRQSLCNLAVLACSCACTAFRPSPCPLHSTSAQKPLHRTPHHAVARVTAAHLSPDALLSPCPAAAPLQGDLPRYYRGHDCFLFTSQYEAWGMPVSCAGAG